MKPKICIALPIHSGNIEEINIVLEKVIKLHPDFIELRFDYIDSLSELTEEFVLSITEGIPSSISVIFTFRKSSEGGKFKIKEDYRYKIIDFLLDFSPDYLDIEISTSNEYLGKVIAKCLEKEINLIFSYHDFNKTPSTLDECCQIVEHFQKRLTHDLHVNITVLKANTLKLIFTAQSIEDCIVPLQACKFYSENQQKIISFCMGELGILSRVLSVFNGAFFTFASFEESTASGQININILRKFFEFFS
ncbi:MAG: type I 3-dehydroquinate dehydratase [Promethearchaeota archaeon]